MYSNVILKPAATQVRGSSRLHHAGHTQNTRLLSEHGTVLTPPKTALTFSDRLGVFKGKSGRSSRGYPMVPGVCMEPSLWRKILRWHKHPGTMMGMAWEEWNARTYRLWSLSLRALIISFRVILENRELGGTGGLSKLKPQGDDVLWNYRSRKGEASAMGVPTRPCFNTIRIHLFTKHHFLKGPHYRILSAKNSVSKHSQLGIHIVWVVMFPTQALHESFAGADGQAACDRHICPHLWWPRSHSVHLATASYRSCDSWGRDCFICDSQVLKSDFALQKRFL